MCFGDLNLQNVNNMTSFQDSFIIQLLVFTFYESIDYSQLLNIYYFWNWLFWSCKLRIVNWSSNSDKVLNWIFYTSSKKYLHFPHFFNKLEFLAKSKMPSLPSWQISFPALFLFKRGKGPEKALASAGHVPEKPECNNLGCEIKKKKMAKFLIRDKFSMLKRFGAALNRRNFPSFCLKPL